MFSRYMITALMLLSTTSYAFERCPPASTLCENTPLGKLEYVWGKNSEDKKSHIYLNGKNLFKNDSNQIGSDLEGWTLNSKNLVSKIVVFYDFNTPQYITTDPKYGELYRYRAYRLFDFSGDKVIISNEFYPPAEYAKLKWVSWGQKNSVIAFEDGSRFRYENGKVTMINAGSESKEQ